MTFYMMTTEMGSICHHLRGVRNQNVHDHDMTFRKGPMSDVNIPIEMPCLTSYLMATVMFALSLFIYEIFGN